MARQRAVSKAEQAALRFISAVNAHDVATLTALMTSDHIFIDAVGREVAGASVVIERWTRDFQRTTDYRITVEHCLGYGDIVAIFGTESGRCVGAGDGTPAKSAWSAPIALKAIVRKGLIATWQVYVDRGPLHDAASGGMEKDTEREAVRKDA